MKIEKDVARISSGVVNEKTTGAPIAIEIENKDYSRWKDKVIEPMTTPRPGHADLSGAIKYRHPDLRHSLERASARETAMRVCVGSLCMQMLKPFGVCFQSKILSLGEQPINLSKEAYIRQVMKAGDTLGGVFEVNAHGVPAGLGSYTQWDKRLDGQIAQALISIPAMKGVEIGPAFENATKLGTQVHDPIRRDEFGNLTRLTNHAGGIEGGISNGEPIVALVAMKPISTTLASLPSVNLQTGVEQPYKYERSDFCALERALIIGESMLAFVIANAFLKKCGGDSFEEIQERYTLLKRAKLGDFKLDAKPWKFNYDKHF